MNKIITFLGLAIINLIISPVTATSFTLQTVTQLAIVDGANNQVEQKLDQVISDYFSIKLDFNDENFKLFELSYRNESYPDAIFEQSSKQEASIFGIDHQVLQQVNQTQVNFFEVSFNSMPWEEINFKNNSLMIAFLEKFRDLVWNDTSMMIEQLSLQDVLIEGENNEVTQTVNQTAIAVFEFDTDLSLKPLMRQLVQNTFYRSLELDNSNQLTQQVKQTWIDIFVFGTDPGIDNLNLNELISLAESPHLPLPQSPNYSQLLPTVPEPTSIISLLVLGTFGLLVKIY